MDDAGLAAALQTIDRLGAEARVTRERNRAFAAASMPLTKAILDAWRDVFGQSTTYGFAAENGLYVGRITPKDMLYDDGTPLRPLRMPDASQPNNTQSTDRMDQTTMSVPELRAPADRLPSAIGARGAEGCTLGTRSVEGRPEGGAQRPMGEEREPRGGYVLIFPTN